MPHQAPRPFDADTFVKSLPELPGVYRMLDSDAAVLYVGKAKSLKKRVSSYFNRALSSPRTALMVAQIAAIEITVTRSEAEALLLENNLIKRLDPKYNIVFRDDKSYPYIRLSNNPFPRITFFRGKPDRDASYFGPYPSAWSVRSSLHLLQKIFRLRTCEDAVFANRSRACLLYQIHRCSGPCVGHIAAETYDEDVKLARLFLGGQAPRLIRQITERMEKAAAALDFEKAAIYRDQIRQLGQLRDRQYVTGLISEDCDIVAGVAIDDRSCVVLAIVRGGEHLGDKILFPEHAAKADMAEIVGNFLRQHYAAHPVPARIVCNTPLDAEVIDDVTLIAAAAVPVALPRGDQQRAWVEMAEKNGRVAILARRESGAVLAEQLDGVREFLGLSEPPERIECFDISHTQGEGTVASCVVCENGAMKPSDYRQFNIRDVTPGDDYAAIAQAVSRRYKGLVKGEGQRPDLVIIDGGAGQVGKARDALNELGLSDLALIGLAKGVERKSGAEAIVFPDRRMPLQLPSDDRGFQLLLQIRDEAHRFALGGHRLRRAKARRTSRLDAIVGVGAQRRKQLIARFGSADGVTKATVDEIASLPGIGRKLAEQIYLALH